MVWALLLAHLIFPLSRAMSVAVAVPELDAAQIEGCDDEVALVTDLHLLFDLRQQVNVVQYHPRVKNHERPQLIGLIVDALQLVVHFLHGEHQLEGFLADLIEFGLVEL